MFKDSFCSSPWFHIRITYNGDFVPCRWQIRNKNEQNFSDTSIMSFYNSEQMKNLRMGLLAGNEPSNCAECYYSDKHSKLSGRIKQLNKSGVMMDHFDLSLRSSPHYELFKYSQENDGESLYYPVDLQIDLGNTCNSACIMCHPFASSRLHQDYKKLNKIDVMFEYPKEYTSWTKDPEKLNKFADQIAELPHIRYIHFLGGETLYDEAFYTLCERLIENGMSKHIIVGTTTNGTVYNSRIENLIRNFKEFHLGISIESVTDLNDYIRYPSNVANIKHNLLQFLNLRKTTALHTTLRITPNIFSVYYIDSLFDFMLEHDVIGESCNILTSPAQLRIELLPEDIRQEIVNKLKRFEHQASGEVNIRRPDLSNTIIKDLIAEYKTFIETYQTPENVEELRFELVRFIKAFESIRNNNILDYAPRYEKFLRHYGY